MNRYKEHDIPPIWVVNLKESSDRQKYISNHLQELGLDFQLIEAVNGRELSEAELAALYDPVQAKKLILREMAPGEIGCSLSHLKIYQKMIDENVAEVLVLEDDAQIDPECLEILQHKNRFPPDWELMLLFHDGEHHTSFRKRRKILKQYRAVKFINPPYGTLGYITKLSAARKLLAKGYPIRVPADELTGGGVKSGIALYGINPPCIRHLYEFNPDITTIPGRKVMQQKYFGNHHQAKKLVERLIINTKVYWRKNVLVQYKRLHSKYII